MSDIFTGISLYRVFVRLRERDEGPAMLVVSRQSQAPWLSSADVNLLFFLGCFEEAIWAHADTSLSERFVDDFAELAQAPTVWSGWPQVLPC